jgi:hypothetical protein
MRVDNGSGTGPVSAIVVTIGLDIPFNGDQKDALCRSSVNFCLPPRVPESTVHKQRQVFGRNFFHAASLGGMFLLKIPSCFSLKSPHFSLKRASRCRSVVLDQKLVNYGAWILQRVFTPGSPPNNSGRAHSGH